ncbi:TetR-like C-terminal domain-containing protein [Streptomyces sp. NPDC055103]
MQHPQAAGTHFVVVDQPLSRRAGVGKHTVHRRWPSKAALIFDALGHAWTTGLDYRDTGDVRADLRAQFLRSSAALSEPPLGPLHRAVIAEAQADPDLRADLHQRFLATVEQRAFDRVTRAQRAVELAADADLAFPTEVLCGTLYYRYLLSNRPVGPAEVDALIEMFLLAYGTRGTRG